MRPIGLQGVKQHLGRPVHVHEAGRVGEQGLQRRLEIVSGRLQGHAPRGQGPGQRLAQAEAQGKFPGQLQRRPAAGARRGRSGTARRPESCQARLDRRSRRPCYSGRFIRTSRTVRLAEFITREWVWTKPPSLHHAVQQGAVGDPGGGEDGVGADDLVQVVFAVEVGDADPGRRGPSRRRCGTPAGPGTGRRRTSAPRRPARPPARRPGRCRGRRRCPGRRCSSRPATSPSVIR